MTSAYSAKAEVGVSAFCGSLLTETSLFASQMPRQAHPIKLPDRSNLACFLDITIRPSRDGGCGPARMVVESLTPRLGIRVHHRRKRKSLAYSHRRFRCLVPRSPRKPVPNSHSTPSRMPV